MQASPLQVSWERRSFGFACDATTLRRLTRKWLQCEQTTALLQLWHSLHAVLNELSLFSWEVLKLRHCHPGTPELQLSGHGYG